MTLFPRSLEEWYKPFTKEERIWFILAIVVALILAITTLTWPIIDAKHQVPAESYAISPTEFGNLALKFKDEYANKEVPEGVDVYIAVQKWFFTPAKIILKSGVTYRIHVSSVDILYGFSLIGKDSTVYNLMIMPGMAYVIKIKFDKPGIYDLICNEYCGTYHHLMKAQIEVR
jgi:cytochrome c oxidase subunit 2